MARTETDLESPKTSPLQEPAPRLPPFQRGWPILGVAWQMRVDPLSLMLQMLETHGDAVRMKLAQFNATLIRHPDHIRRVLVDNVANYTKQTRGFRKATIALGQGLVTSQGALWQRQRRIATPAFSRQRIAGFGAAMIDATEQMLARWREPSVAAAPVDVFRELMRLTMRIALQTLLGVSAEGEIDVLAGAVSEILERTNDLITNPYSLPMWAPTPKNSRMKAALQTLDRFVYATIERRRSAPQSAESPGGGDLLTMLMDARDEETGQGMTDQQLRDEAVTILIAGHETTANALAWACYLLSQHPVTAEQLRKEVATIAPGRSLTVEDLPRLTFTRAVIEESMRLYPPAWIISRQAIADDTLGPYLIPAGTFVLVSPYVTHRHPRLWNDPHGFDPQRFLDGRSANLPKFAYLPFGGGPRFCIGANFAMMEATLVLATIARACEMTLVPGFRVEPYAMITLRPKHGIQMNVEFR